MVISQFIKTPVARCSAWRRPRAIPQSFADLITIEEYKTKGSSKVVMTWAPHPKALPQAVPNSFAEWMIAAGYDFVITHPHGYELDPAFTKEPR